MVAIVRLTCLLLLYFLFTGRPSNAPAQHDGNVAVGSNAVSTGVLELLYARAATREKLAEKVRKVSSAIQRLQTQQRVRKLLFKDVDDVGEFVAFNADYRGPRHHPPKNN